MKMLSFILLAGFAICQTAFGEAGQNGSVGFILRPCETFYRLESTAGIENIGYRAGESVVASNIDTGICLEVVSNAQEGDSQTWIPPSSGYWMLENSYYGAVRFFADTEDYGFTGYGTKEDPLLVLEANDLSAFHDGGTIADGFVLKLSHMLGIESLDIIPNLAFVDLGDDCYRITVPESDELFRSRSVFFFKDTVKDGPNRKVPEMNKPMGISFSGDNWIGDSEAVSTLHITSPSGKITEETFSGTGLFRFVFDEKGRWHVTLETETLALSGAINVGRTGTQILLR